jgi:hypothetical protein
VGQMHFLQILKQVVYPANNVLEGATSMCPFQNNHSPLHPLYMHAAIKQNILYINVNIVTQTDHLFSITEAACYMRISCFILLTKHAYTNTEYSKTLNLCGLLPMCTVTMAVKMMCIMQHNFRLEFIS